MLARLCLRRLHRAVAKSFAVEQLLWHESQVYGKGDECKQDKTQNIKGKAGFDGHILAALIVRFTS